MSYKDYADSPIQYRLCFMLGEKENAKKLAIKNNWFKWIFLNREIKLMLIESELIILWQQHLNKIMLEDSEKEENKQ